MTELSLEHDPSRSIAAVQPLIRLGATRTSPNMVIIRWDACLEGFIESKIGSGVEQRRQNTRALKGMVAEASPKIVLEIIVLSPLWKTKIWGGVAYPVPLSENILLVQV